MRHAPFIRFLFLLAAIGGFSWAESGKTAVIGMHCLIDSEEQGLLLEKEIPKLAEAGVNLLFVEVGYSFDWKSHPELAVPGALSASTAQAIAAACTKRGIEVIPELNCVGHQSWESWTLPLLSVYPDLDESPGLYPRNQGIYCRSWCVSNPAAYAIVFDLIDELSEAFSARSFHVGLDEILIFGEDACPRCRGKDRGQLFAKAVNELHRHIVGEKGLVMYMWGDRLLNGSDPDSSGPGDEYDRSMNGTHRAIDRIPHDIVICDWHYAKQTTYPSIPYFISKGFNVLPASYDTVEAAQSFIDYSLSLNERNMIGHLYTTWNEVGPDALHAWPPLVRTAKKLRKQR